MDRMLGGIGTGQNMVHFGNRGDVCFLCSKDLSKYKNINITSATNELKGSLDGQKIFKIRIAGTDFSLCMKHIHKIAKDNPIEEELEEIVGDPL